MRDIDFIFLTGVAVIDRKIYVLGGEEGWDRYHDTIECYDPDTDEWTIVGKLLSPRACLGCAPLNVSIEENAIVSCMEEILNLTRFKKSVAKF